MKMLATTLFLFLLGADSANADCHANNCARQVTGTRLKIPNLTSRQADCANFMTTTVYPTPTAITYPAVYNRKRSPVTTEGAFPAYATDCDDPAAYSSVCSCWGYTSAIITVSTPITTAAGPTVTCQRGAAFTWLKFVRGDTAAPGVVPYNANDGIPYIQKYDPVIFQSAHAGAGADHLIPSVDDNTAVTYIGTPLYASTPYLYPDLVPEQFWGVTWRSYFNPQLTGPYTFSLNKVDDVAVVWLGPQAASGWTVGNSLLSGYATYSARPYPLNVTTVNGVPGQLLPFRIQWVNAQDQYAFEFTVTDPNGIVGSGPELSA